MLIASSLIILTLTTASIQAQQTRTLGPGSNRVTGREHIRRTVDDSSDLEDLRRELTAFLQEMEEAARPIVDNQMTRPTIAQSGLDPLERLTDARRRVTDLTHDHLIALRAALTRNPGWRELPLVINSLLTPEVRQKLLAQSLNGGTENNHSHSEACQAARLIGVTLTDISIARAAALSARITMESLPTDGPTLAARLAPVAAWSAAEGVLMSLESLNALADSCDAADSQNGVNGRLDVSVSTRASQSSVDNLNSRLTDQMSAARVTLQGVDALQVSAASISSALSERLDARLSTRAAQTSVDALQTATEAINSRISDRLDAKLSTRASQAGVDALQTTASNISASVNDRLDARISTRASQAGVDALQITSNAIISKTDALQITTNALNGKTDALQNTASAINGKTDALQNTTTVISGKTDALQTTTNVINSKTDTLNTKLDSFQEMQLRLVIENALLQGPRYNMALLQVPEAQGGLLGRVREIAADTILKMRNSGLSTISGSAIDQAEQALATGDNLLVNRAWKDAFAWYRQAYLHLTIVPNMRLP
jgi:hypothetical protein